MRPAIPVQIAAMAHKSNDKSSNRSKSDRPESDITLYFHYHIALIITTTVIIASTTAIPVIASVIVTVITIISTLQRGSLYDG